MKNTNSKKPFRYIESNVSKTITSLKTKLPVLNPDPPETHMVEPRKVNHVKKEGRYASNVGVLFSKKAIEYESTEEKDFYKRLDAAPAIVWYDVQRIKIEYLSDEGDYIYHPDIICILDNDQVLVIEVKPVETMCERRNIKKYIAAKQQCKANGWHYIIMSRNGMTIEDAASERNPAIEKAFLREFERKDTNAFRGVGYREMKEFGERYGGVKDVELVTVALNNDLALADKPYRYIKLQNGLSWKQVLMPLE